MYYSIRHVTRYRYSTAVRENVTEARMQPRNEGRQRCLAFSLTVVPRASVSSYQDHLGNTIHHFDVPGPHTSLTLTAEAHVEMQPFAPLSEQLCGGTWETLDGLANDSPYWDLLRPSRYARPTPSLHALAEELSVDRSAYPLTVLRRINQAIYERFVYVPQSTRVESPIDDALRNRRGVCQDFTHIMIALGRQLGIPCRYVSGYLYHRFQDHDRSAEDATHAWMEAFLPELGWIGFDPTNDLIAAERHIRVAVGRDYADVPPTRGVYKGHAEEELSVGVRVAPADAPEEEEELLPPLPPSEPTDEEAAWMQEQ